MKLYQRKRFQKNVEIQMKENRRRQISNIAYVLFSGRVCYDMKWLWEKSHLNINFTCKHCGSIVIQSQKKSVAVRLLDFCVEKVIEVPRHKTQRFIQFSSKIIFVDSVSLPCVRDKRMKVLTNQY